MEQAVNMTIEKIKNYSKSDEHRIMIDVSRGLCQFMMT